MRKLFEKKEFFINTFSKALQALLHHEQHEYTVCSLDQVIHVTDTASQNTFTDWPEASKMPNTTKMASAAS